MPGCSVKSCENWNGNTKGKNIKFFTFPKTKEFQISWFKACNADVINLKNARVCSEHFTPDCFRDTRHLCIPGQPPVIKLRDDAIPTEKLSGQIVSPIVSPKKQPRKRKILSNLLERNNETPIKKTRKMSKIDNLKNNSVEESSLLQTSTVHENENLSSFSSCEENDFEDNDSNHSNTDQIVVKINDMNVTQVSDTRHTRNTQKINSKNMTKEEYYANESSQIVMGELEKAKARYENLIASEEKLIARKVNEKTSEILSHIFTPGQIKKLLHPDRKTVKWTSEDIASAISLKSVSAKAYKYLLSKNFPLPGLSTLRKWAVKIDMKEGVIETVLCLMKKRAQTLKERDKLCVLSFDKMDLSPIVEIDKREDKRVGPHKMVQAGMVQGLFSRWEQPIYYDFDTSLNISIVLEVIERLYNAGYVVVAVTTDIGPLKNHLWGEFHVGIDDNENCFFTHPCDDLLKIFVFIDASHLLKLMRNRLINTGFVIENKFVSKEYLVRLLSVDIEDPKIAHKLKEKHLDCKGAERKKTYLAAQVFSNSTAEAIRFCGINGYFDSGTNICDDYQDLVDLLKLGNDWFDILNSSMYGVDLRYQNSILNKMTDLMNDMIVVGSESLCPFQKGIILTNTSLQQLNSYLVEKYSPQLKVSFITRRLSKDVLENFFSYITAMGTEQLDQPSALQFKYRLRWHILNKQSADMANERNSIKVDDTSVVEAEEIQRSSSPTNQVIFYF